MERRRKSLKRSTESKWRGDKAPRVRERVTGLGHTSETKGGVKARRVGGLE